MTLLDRFRTQPRQKHPDPAVRLAYIAELPLSERDQIIAAAREDEDPKVRRAAVAKLMDAAALGSVADTDPDAGVRAEAVAMLRDIALDAFEGVTEAESLAAVAVLHDPKMLAQIARTSLREEVGRRALDRIEDVHLVAAVARQAALEPVRQAAFERLSARDDIMSVAVNSEFRDTAVAAVERLADRTDLEQVAARARNKAAAKRARTIVRDMDERAAREREETEAAMHALANMDVPVVPSEESVAAAAPPPVAMETAPPIEGVEALEETPTLPELPSGDAGSAAGGDAQLEAERRRARLTELAADAESAAADADVHAARRRMSLVRREWKDLTAAAAVDAALAERLAQAEALVADREAKATEAEARTRRDALTRMRQLIARVEALPNNANLSLKAAERALKDVRSAVADIPPMPSRQDYEEVSRRLKAAQAVLAPKVQELREATDWRQWANLGVQEQLCVRMEALRGVDDADQVVRRIRELQQQWREVADVPRAQGEALWTRFKGVHDELWKRAETQFAQQAEERAANLSKKVALCERVETLIDSTNWIATANAIKQAQSEWKAIGAVTRGQEKAIWERFRSACDRFFTRRHDDLIKRKAQWAENLARKEALAARAEALVESTDWDASAGEIRRLQVEWKTIGPVKKSRSEAVWQRFRGACDGFFTRFNQRHDLTRGERIAAREGICAELEGLGGDNASAQDEPPADLVAKIRGIRAKWQHEIASRAIDRETAAALDARFAAGHARVLSRWPAAFAGTDLDPETNRKRMETLVKRVEDLAASIARPETSSDAGLSPTTRLAAMLKEALAANTIGGKVDVDARRRAALEEIRDAQASWSRIGPVPDELRRPLADRFQRAVRRISEAMHPGGPATRRQA
jgi:hypothetical protein